MKHLAILGFVVGLLGIPIHAQAQQSMLGSPQGFNGLSWDSSFGGIPGYGQLAAPEDIAAAIPSLNKRDLAAIRRIAGDVGRSKKSRHGRATRARASMDSLLARVLEYVR
jgi:hypothetical protein